MSVVVVSLDFPKAKETLELSVVVVAVPRTDATPPEAVPNEEALAGAVLLAMLNRDGAEPDVAVDDPKEKVEDAAGLVVPVPNANVVFSAGLLVASAAGFPNEKEEVVAGCVDGILLPNANPPELEPAVVVVGVAPNWKPPEPLEVRKLLKFPPALAVVVVLAVGGAVEAAPNMGVKVVA